MQKFKTIVKMVIHKIVVPFFKSPYFSLNKAGFSLVRSQLINIKVSEKAKYSAPYILRNVEIGDYTYIGSNSNINNTVIGKFCSIGPNFCCGMGIHPLNGISTSPMFYSTVKQNGFSCVNQNIFVEEKEINIGHDVFIGVNVTVLDGVTIGNGAVVGAGSVVCKDIPPYAIVGGVPAKIIKYRFSEDIVEKLNKIEWWSLGEMEFDKIVADFFNVEKYVRN